SKRWCCPASGISPIARRRSSQSMQLSNSSTGCCTTTRRRDRWPKVGPRLEPGKWNQSRDCRLMNYNAYEGRADPSLKLEFGGGGRSARTEIMMAPADYAKADRAAHEQSDMTQSDKRVRIDFQTEPSRYRHWKLKVDGEIATLVMDVDEKSALFEGYDLKLNSYDLGVDIELADSIERLRFEHPGVRVLVLRSAKPRVFSAGANIRMLAGASHAHKVNFCKFTNETRNGIEDLSENSGIKSICAINGTAAGGGYELALATD